METNELLSLREVAERVGVHYMTAYRWVRTGRLPATKRGGTWVVESQEVERLAIEGGGERASASGTGDAADAQVVARPGRPQPGVWAGRLEGRLTAGDEAGAWSVVDAAQAAGMSPEAVYTGVVAPAMASIGERWAAGKLEIEEEHQASAIVLRLIGRLGPQFLRPGRRRGTVVLGAPAGDDHGIPLHLVGDLLRARGFAVVDLGPNTPPSAFAGAVARADDLVGVGVCATRPDNDPAVAEAVAAVAASTGVPVVLGGLGVADTTEACVAEALGGAVLAPEGVASAPAGRHRVVRTHSTEEAVACFEQVTSATTTNS
jgi:excisionase family DNA binding protein